MRDIQHKSDAFLLQAYRRVVQSVFELLEFEQVGRDLGFTDTECEQIKSYLLLQRFIKLETWGGTFSLTTSGFLQGERLFDRGSHKSNDNMNEIIKIRRKSDSFLLAAYERVVTSGFEIVDFKDIVEQLGLTDREFNQVETYLTMQHLINRGGLGGINGDFTLTTTGFNQGSRLFDAVNRQSEMPKASSTPVVSKLEQQRIEGDVRRKAAELKQEKADKDRVSEVSPIAVDAGTDTPSEGQGGRVLKDNKPGDKVEKEYRIKSTPGHFLDAVEYYLAKTYGLGTFIGSGHNDLIDVQFGFSRSQDWGWLHLHTIPDGLSLLQVTWDANKLRVAELWAVIEAEMRRQGFIVEPELALLGPSSSHYSGNQKREGNLSVRLPGRPRDEIYDQAFRRIIGGEDQGTVFVWVCQEKGWKNPRKAERDAFKAAMKRRRKGT